MNIFLLSATVSMSSPVGCAVFAATRWLLARHALTVAFNRGRERRVRPNSWRQ